MEKKRFSLVILLTVCCMLFASHKVFADTNLVKNWDFEQGEAGWTSRNKGEIMSKVTIMLACAAGMSTSLLVTKMQAAADEKGLDAEIFAVPAPEVDDILSEKKVDVLLLGPQVRYLLDQFTEKLAQKNIPVGVIPMVDYGMMNGSKVLALAEELIGG